MNRRMFLKSLLAAPFSWKSLLSKEVPTDGTEEVASRPDSNSLPIVSDWQFPLPVYIKIEDGEVRYCPDISAQNPAWYKWTAKMPFHSPFPNWSGAWEFI